MSPSKLTTPPTDKKADKLPQTSEQSPKHSNKKPWLWLVLGFLLTVGGVAAVRLFNSDSPAQQQETAQPQGTPVKLQRVKSSILEDSSTFVGTLEAQQGLVLKPKVAGRVTKILVTSGTEVTVGTPIIELSREQSLAEVNSAIAEVNIAKAARDNAKAQLATVKAELASAEAELKLHSEQYRRTSFLVKEGAQSQQELDLQKRNLDAASAALKAAQERVRAAEASLNQANSTMKQAQADAAVVEEDLQDRRIVAPIKGVVGDIPVKLGDYVDIGDTLTTITQNQNLQLEIAIPLEKAEQLRIGTPVELYRFQGSEQPIVKGSISFISPRTNFNSQTILAKAIFSNPGNRLQDGQKAAARVIWRSRRGVLIPTSAVSRLGGQNFVYVAQEQLDPLTGETQLIAKQKPVKLGSIQGNEYQVLEGIEPGEQLIVSGLLNLSHGAAIAPKSEVKYNDE